MTTPDHGQRCHNCRHLIATGEHTYDNPEGMIGDTPLVTILCRHCSKEPR